MAVKGDDDVGPLDDDTVTFMIVGDWVGTTSSVSWVELLPMVTSSLVGIDDTCSVGIVECN